MIRTLRGFVLKLLILILVIIAGIITGGYYALIRGVPSVKEIRIYRPSKATKIYADDDTLIGEFKVEKGEYVPFSRIPEHLIRAVISIEDSRFWYHSGVDYVAIMRALLRDIMARKIREGASTITQQLAKVVFLSPERTVVRKLREIVLASRLEEKLTKEEILELYLNRIYFGHGAYGVEMASRVYFGKSVSDLTLAESALIAGLIRAPSRYSPYNSMKRAKDRQKVVLRRMVQEGYITEQQAMLAYKQPLYLSSAKSRKFRPNYFLEYIRRYLEEKYGVEMTYKGGLKVYTTLNRDMQIAAVDSLREGLRMVDKRQGFRGPLSHRAVEPDKEIRRQSEADKRRLRKGDLLTAIVISVRDSQAIVNAQGVVGKLPLKDARWAKRLINERGEVLKIFTDLRLRDILKVGDVIYVRVEDNTGDVPVFALEQEPLVQGAVVAMEPSTGYVRVIVGGYDFNKSEFNRAINAKRQAGSAFKPFIYAAAMDYGFTPASLIMDEPIRYESDLYGDWEPENYEGRYYGPTRLREALIHSRNIVTVKLLEQLGVGKVIDFAERLGIKGPFPRNLTLALGSLSVSPFELTSAFSVFANGGVRMKPIVVKYILDSSGNILENNEPSGERVISPQTAYLATSMLEDVVRYGTGWRARALRRHVAGKTGTTNEYRDAWFIGYTPELVACVWVGFDNSRSLGEEETGSRAAAPIWVSFMKRALRQISATNGSTGRDRAFTIPDGIVTAVIDPVTGLLATPDSGKMVEFFKEGSVPTLYSTAFYRNLVTLTQRAMRAIRREEGDRTPGN